MARDIATRVRAFTLFATHYFELTTLASEVEGCANVHLDATEHGDGIVFLHAVKDGPANRSYGLQVAQLAGVPRQVIGEARLYLERLELERERERSAASDRGSGTSQAQLALFQSARDPLRTALLEIDPEELSPREALDALYRLKTLRDESRSARAADESVEQITFSAQRALRYCAAHAASLKTRPHSRHHAPRRCRGEQASNRCTGCRSTPPARCWRS